MQTEEAKKPAIPDFTQGVVFLSQLPPGFSVPHRIHDKYPCRAKLMGGPGDGDEAMITKEAFEMGGMEIGDSEHPGVAFRYEKQVNIGHNRAVFGYKGHADVD